MKRKIYILATLCILFSTTTVAQNSNILYGVTRIPQMHNANPAFFPIHTKSYTNTFGLNITGSIPMSLNELIRDTTVNGQRYNFVDANSIIDLLKENNQFNLGLDMNLPGFGFKLGNKCFFTLGIQSHIDGNFGIPIQVLNLITDGNIDPNGIPQTISLVNGDLLGMQAYMSVPIGFGIKFNNLTVGLRVKPMLGLFEMNTSDTYVNLHTEEDLNKIMASVHYNAQIALPVNVNLPETASLEELPDYLNFSSLFQGFSFATMQPNLGLGVDLGAKYDFLGFEFSASVLDLGGIKWNNVYNLHPRNGAGEFAFEGIDASGLINGATLNMDSITQIYQNEVDELLNAHLSKGESYITRLNPKFNLGAFYKVPIASNLGLTIRAGLLWHGELIPRMATLEDAKKNLLYQNITAMASVNLFDWLELTVSNSVIHNGYQTLFFNPGASVNLMLLRRLQFFTLVDYGAFNFIDSKEINAYIGMNMLFGRRKLWETADAAPIHSHHNGYLL